MHWRPDWPAAGGALWTRSRLFDTTVRYYQNDSPTIFHDISVNDDLARKFWSARYHFQTADGAFQSRMRRHSDRIDMFGRLVRLRAGAARARARAGASAVQIATDFVERVERRLTAVSAIHEHALLEGKLSQ